MGWFAWADRTEAQIAARVEAEIADELEFHLEERTRALVEEGLSAEAARAEAERRFGSVERVRKDCRWVQLGERIMLQRVQVVLNVVLATAVVALGWGYWRENRQTQEMLQRMSALMELRAREPAPETPQEPDPLRERFKALKDEQGVAELASEILRYSPAGAREALADGWSSVRDPRLRSALLAPFMAGGGHAEAIGILDLGATDADAAVREQAFRYLKSYAWQDFSGKPLSLYQEWHERVDGGGVVNALQVSVTGYQSRLALLRGAALVRELELLEEIDLAPGNLRGFDSLHTLWTVGGDNARGLAQRWLATDDPALQLATLRFVAHFRLDSGFLGDLVVDALAGQVGKSKPHVLAACRALATGDQIELEPYSGTSLGLLLLCAEDDTPEVRQVVGAGVLARLWQLPADPERGAEQWLVWWRENRGSFSDPRLRESLAARTLDAR